MHDIVQTKHALNRYEIRNNIVMGGDWGLD